MRSDNLRFACAQPPTSLQLRSFGLFKQVIWGDIWQIWKILLAFKTLSLINLTFQDTCHVLGSVHNSCMFFLAMLVRGFVSHEFRYPAPIFFTRESD